MARKSVLELQEAFEGLKFSFLSTNKALSRNKTLTNFLSIQKTLQFLFSEKNIFYYNQNCAPFIGAKKFIKINNNKLRVLNDF